MKVAFSTESRKKIFHSSGCPYARRILYKNRMIVKIAEAEDLGYHACSYCCTMRGFYNINRKRFDAEAKKNDLKLTFDSRTDTLYIRTDVGAWKIFMMPDGQYRLHHLNGFFPTMTDRQVVFGKYHRQTDIKPNPSPFPLINYIAKHDMAKKIIKDDYRKLPQGTKKEKQYYKKAQRRSMLEKKKAVSELLDCISRGETPASKWISIC